jgi:DNA-directed RNA polymerase specialized sigma24 family protein
MAVAEEVTYWILKLRHGDEQAAQLLWEAYFEKLVCFARRKLEGMPRRAVDEEDVALSAMHSFCCGMKGGRFRDVKDRHELWKLLITITARKACRERRRDRATKRGGGNVRGESAFGGIHRDEESEQGIGDVLGSEPTPEFACMVAENCRRMMERLDDRTLAEVARLKLEGYTNADIARKLDCVERSVERKVRRIREKWTREEPS